jgi:GNAT superfamily N-acetyltransferase
MPGYAIDELTIPTSIDAPGGEDFAEMVRVRNAIEAHSYGGDDLAYEADELLPGWLDPYEPKRLFVARVDGRIVGRAIHEIQTEAATDVSWLSVEVLPEFRGRGIGSALYGAVLAVATELGRTTLQAYGLAMERPGDRLEAPTGFGSVPLADPGVRFLLARGWSLEQVERSSKLTLPVADLADRVDAAAAASGPDYRVHTWVGATPQRWLEDIAMLATRMSTDAPTAGLDATEDVWSVERILDDEARQAGSPRRQLIAAVEHVPSGRLAGFTELSVPPQLTRAVAQDDTIVLSEHRGHRLGMLLKVANIAHLERVDPGHPSITTFNAEENRHMLSVNEAVGFVAVGYEGAWKKVTG